VRAEQPRKPQPMQQQAQKGGFYNSQQAPSSYYYLRSQPNAPQQRPGAYAKAPPGAELMTRQNYMAAQSPAPGHPPGYGMAPPGAMVEQQQMGMSAAMYGSQQMGGQMMMAPQPPSAQPNVTLANAPLVAPGGATAGEPEAQYVAMIQAATVEVKSNMSVEHLKEHVRDVMLKMTEARSSFNGMDAPSEAEKQKVAREVADALSAKVEMAVATATGHSVEPDASLQVLHDLETRMQRTLNGPHANERMPEAVALREGLARIRGMISVRQS